VNTCLIISSALAVIFLLGVIAALKIQTAVQAARIQWQAQQIQTLQAQRPGCGCGGTLLLLTMSLLVTMLALGLAVSAGAP
jgi:hypothetical protein